MGNQTSTSEKNVENIPDKDKLYGLVNVNKT
jgi:hypothetical protein